MTYIDGDDDLDWVITLACPVAPQIQVAERAVGRLHVEEMG